MLFRSTVSPAAQARNIELHEDCERDALVRGDPDRLQQVVWNLLSNAIKFTPPGGRVTAAVRRVDRDIHITITDTGPGLRPEFIPHVFERFRQDGDGRRSPGLGLGLAIVKELVEMHGGSVYAGNRHDGSGAQFEIVIPHLSGATASPPESDPKTALTRGRALAGLRVLVVDDEPDARDLLEWVLKDLGADVATVGSVRDAMADLSRQRPDVILTDITMPGEDGYSLLQKVRAAVETRAAALPVAAISAAATPADRARALEAGFATHLAKPVQPDALADAILRLTHMTHP